VCSSDLGMRGEVIVFMSSLGWIGFHPKFSSSLVNSLSNLSL
jgi:hypothetical protein